MRCRWSRERAFYWPFFRFFSQFCVNKYLHSRYYNNYWRYFCQMRIFVQMVTGFAVPTIFLFLLSFFLLLSPVRLLQRVKVLLMRNLNFCGNEGGFQDRHFLITFSLFYFKTSVPPNIFIFAIKTIRDVSFAKSAFLWKFRALHSSSYSL